MHGSGSDSIVTRYLNGPYLMSKLNVLLLATLATKLAAAKDVFLDWNITWVNAAPDGFERPVIGINGQWPCPQIDVDLGDRLIVDVYNGLGNQSHWYPLAWLPPVPYWCLWTVLVVSPNAPYHQGSTCSTTSM